MSSDSSELTEHTSTFPDPLASRGSSDISRTTYSDTSTSPRKLCNVCVKIDFNVGISKGFMNPRDLGTWAEIQRSRATCQFCRLLVEAVVNSPSYETNGPRPGSTIYLRKKQAWRCCVSTLGYDGEAAERFSNKADLESMASRTQGKHAYRFVVVWSDSELPGEIQYVSHHKDPSADRHFFGRKVDPCQVDWSLLRGWLRTCAASHGISCDKFGKSSDRLPATLRVMDIEEGYITSLAPDGPPITYIALSYVWGEAEMYAIMPKTMKSDVQLVDGIQRVPIPSAMPRTVVDAIEVTRRLGFRYLWVDALCIIQDDDSDRDYQISRMDAIYNCAALTIAAGSGRHADCGLPGVSVPRTRLQITEVAKGLRFAVPLPSFGKVYSAPDLKWNTRGWTFQEKILSARILLFTDWQVYFRCSNGICVEDVAMEADRLSRNPRRERSPFRWRPDRISQHDPDFKKPKDLTSGVLSALDRVVIGRFVRPPPSDVHLGLFPTYIAIVEEYTVRSFTYQPDVLPAFAGVMRSICEAGAFSVAGLPSKYFLEALLWCPRLGGTCTSFKIANRKKLAPSWSWASRSFSNGCVWNYADRHKTIGSLNWLNAREKYFQKSGSGVDVILREDNSLVKVTLRTPVNEFRIGRQLSGPTQFQEDDDVKVEIFQILNNAGQCVGELWTSPTVARMGGYHTFVRLSSSTSLLEATPPRELVTVTKKEWVTPVYAHQSDGTQVEVRAGYYRDVQVVETRDEWKVENVMLVEIRDDVAYRIAIGKILRTSWDTLDITRVDLG